MTLLERAKLALRISKSVTAYDDEIVALIRASVIDMQVAGVVHSDFDVLDADTETLDYALLQAILTYIKANFGYVDKSDYERLKAAYDEQKAQLTTATGYTEWGDAE